MVKHGLKKEKSKKSPFLCNIKTSEDKTERTLHEGKLELKPSFKKKKTKVLSTIGYRICLRQRSFFQVYDYSNLNCEYFADLYCYLRKYF